MNCVKKGICLGIRSGLSLKSAGGVSLTRTSYFAHGPILQVNRFSTAGIGTDNKICSRLNLGLPSSQNDWLKNCTGNNILFRNNLLQNDVSIRVFSTSETGKPDENKKLTLIQKFKQMYRDYWYVLIPVHCGTSLFWFGGFYMLAESGVDIVQILEFFKINENLIAPFRNGHAKMGYLAVAFALYKIATPFRYTVTLGGTHIAINYLKKFGYIKPIPKKEQLKELYLEKKDAFMEKRNQFSENINQMKPFSRLKEVEGSKRK